jgi:hypothetical protein
MRPVPTWNSTEAAPTPIRLGPRPSTPRPSRPWQLMQLLSNSALPSWAAAESWRVSSAKAPGAKAV